MATKRRQGNNTAKTVAIVVAFVLVFAILAGVLAYLLGGFNNLLTDTYYFRAGDISVTGATVQDEKDRNKYIDDLTSDGLVKIAVNSTEDATAQLLVFVQAKDTDRRLDDLLEVQVNGVRYTAGNVVVKGDGAKDPAWREVILGDVKLNEGENVITIAGTSVGVDLEYIALCVPHGVKLTKLADAPVAESDEERLVVSPEETQGTEAGVSLVTRAIAREQYNTYGIMPIAESAFTATATVKIKDTDDTPDYIKGVTWKMEWAASNSAAVTDYVTMNENEEDMTATFSCKKAFSTKITVTCTSKFDPTASATITLDYRKRVTAIKYKFDTVTGEVNTSQSPTVTATFPVCYAFTAPQGEVFNAFTSADYTKFYDGVVMTEGTLEPSGSSSVSYTVTPSAAFQEKHNSIKDSRNPDMVTSLTATTQASGSTKWMDNVREFYSALTKVDWASGGFFGMGACSAISTAIATTTNQFSVSITTYGLTFKYTLNVKAESQPKVSLTVDQSNFIF